MSADSLSSLSRWQRTAWILECGCEPMIEHCTQCDQRREHARLLALEEDVQRACEAIYREMEGYWPNDSERHRIAIALLAGVTIGGPT